YTSRKYCIVPELLEKNKSLNVAKNTSAGFWLQLKIPVQATAGRYNSKLSLKSGNKLLLQLDLHVRILPFKLEQPKEINWIMHASDLLSRYKDKNHYYTDEELRRYLSDMADYGITGIFGLCYGNIDYLKRTARLVKEVGFKGPLIFHSFAEASVAKQCGLRVKTRHISPEMRKPAFEKKVVDYLKHMDEIIKNEGITNWYYHGFGEVNDYQPDWIKHAVYSAETAKKAGIKLYTTLYPIEIIKQLFPYMPDGINSSGCLASDPEKNSIYHQLAQKNKIALLTLSGTYTGQTGGMMPNRYSAGFLIYKAGGQGHTVWTYQRVQSKGGPNPWGRPCMAYPASKISAEEVSVSTLQWEGTREGIDDYKYLYTLTQWIKRAKEKGLMKEARTAQDTLDNMVKQMPWGSKLIVGNCYLKPGNFSNADASNCRRKIADMIIGLKKSIEEKK
ncbi:MAG: hypothetical protein PHV82_16575, partial [Victivallaceae bacterium]|nr:hypothetical protein [Victivallaceae bacterium]